MLRVRPRSVFLLAGASLVLWVVPSIGTQGMGTIGQRIAHTDAALFDANPTVRTASAAALARADAAAEGATGL